MIEINFQPVLSSDRNCFMRDILDRKDIEKLVEDFYLKALNDKKIGYIFTDVAEIDLQKHLPIISDFWEMIIFRNVNFLEKYGRSPMMTHVLLNEKENLKTEIIRQWLKLFCETVDEKFVGENADLAKTRAVSIGEMMIAKFNAEKSEVFQVVRG